MTNAVIETLMTRRSVRAFQEKAIPADQLQAGNSPLRSKRYGASDLEIHRCYQS